jgi:chloride channel protein, CIC family
MTPVHAGPLRSPSRALAPSPFDRRVLVLCGLCAAVALAATAAASLLGWLIAAVTQLAWYGRLAWAPASPAGNALGAWAAAVPVAGALAVGVLARYGSPSIRGHGIPEAMEGVLVNESRIAPRVALLKPLSAAISIGTGGPFGAEGPIIATGGAIGSLLGQVVPVSSAERKVLLAAGAAAGMAATFGTPLAAVLLAVELLLFEFRARSIVPVAFAVTIATAARATLGGGGAPMFAVPGLSAPGAPAVAAYVVLGAAGGLAAVAITRALHAVEAAFERLPIHWMWWPALGATVVGGVGLVAPRALGVGYDNIQDVLDGRLLAGAALALAAWKLLAWTVALGSGTSGGTLAPLFTIGGALGAAAGAGLAHAFPGAHLDLRLAALVGMSAVFAGASRATLTSAVFALEITQAPAAMAPLLGATAAASLVSWLLMRHSIMTAKIARRGLVADGGYEADPLAHVPVRDGASRAVAALAADEKVTRIRAWIAAGAPGSSHQGYPVVDRRGVVVGVVTRRDLLEPAADGDAPVLEIVKRPPITVGEGASMRDALEAMVEADVGRLPVVDDRGRLSGFLTRSDVLAAHRSHLAARRIPPARSSSAPTAA